jgi:hypothetical protein
MTNTKAAFQELTIKPDLHKLIKYHPASAVFLKDDPNVEYVTSFEVKVLLEEINGEYFLADDYQYAKIIDECMPASGHDANLLGLVKNLIELEWGYYLSYYILDESSQTHKNQYAHATKLLQELKIMFQIIEEKKTQDVCGKLQLREFKLIGRKLKAYNVPTMQIDFEGEDECLAIMELLINRRIKTLYKPEYSYYPFNVQEFDHYSSTSIQGAIDRMKQSFRDFRAQWLFCKLVCEKALAYLKGEMQWNQGGVDITENQGVVIHTLLALFNLIPPDQELLNNTKRLKAKYIRTFFRKDLADNEEAFHKFVNVTNGPEIDEKEKVWLRAT